MANKLEGISVALPLTYDSQDGPYRLNKNLRDTIKQNFKNLILTSPGERIMVPDFGAGVRRILFQSYTEGTFEEISSAILSQVEIYMPFVDVENIFVQTSEEDSSLSPNSVRVIIKYNIGDVDDGDTLIITQPND